MKQSTTPSKKISLNAEVVDGEHKRKLDSEEAVQTTDLIADIMSRLGPDLVLDKGKGQIKPTQHIVIGTSSSEYFIISRLATRDDVQLITVDPELGTLRYEHQPHHDLFDTIEDALEHITTSLGLEITYRCVARALLGYAVLGATGCLFVATRVAGDSVLPGGHVVYTIAETAWIRIPLRITVPEDATEQKNIDSLTKFQINGLHFYCETCDITRGFPFDTDLYANYDRSFSWNEFLSDSFARHGLREWCPVLLQGSCRCSLYPDGISLCLIAKKCSENPGTRYNARGMNARNSPGNELECELIVWTRTRWARYAWRRGTVPIWWRSEPPKGVGDSDIIVRDNDPYAGCDVYMNGVMERFGRPLTIVNLLAESPLKRESFLSEHFKKAIAGVNEANGTDDIKLVNYDWHARMKELGQDGNVESLWTTLRETLEASGISYGGFSSQTDQGEIEPLSRDVRLDAEATQVGICRFNCADSLDRTNIVTFFVCIQVLGEMCYSMKIRGFDKETGEEGDTKGGWYGSGMDYKKLAGMLSGIGLLRSLSDAFIFTGDVCSILYTCSFAAYSGPMRQYSSNPKDAPSNAMIAVQRRYQNMVNDPFRQTQFEMFCGIKRTEYFPSLVRTGNGNCMVPPLEIVSDYPSCILSKSDVSSEKRRTTTITFAMRRPAVLQELLLSIAYPSEIRHTDTCHLTLCIGPYVDALRPVFHRLAVPTANAGVPMKYLIPTTVWDGYREQQSSSFNESSYSDGCTAASKAIIGVYSRFARIVLVSNNPTITIGRAELRGRPLAAGPLAVCASSTTAAADALHGYEDMVANAASKRSFDFNTALTLEVARIDGGISPAERDEVMMRHNLTCEFDPCTYVYKRDESLEAKLLENTTCSDACSECKTTESTFVCPGCRQRLCRKCGAPVLQSIPEYLLCAPRLVCKTCLPLIQRRDEMFAVQQQQEMLENVAAFSPAQLIRSQGIAEYAHEIPDLCAESTWKLRGLKDIRREEADLARFPRACFVHSLPLGADNNLPPEAMLIRGNKVPWTVSGEAPLNVAISFMGDALVTSVDIGFAEGTGDVVVEAKATSTLEGLEDTSDYVQVPASGPLPTLLRGSIFAIRITSKDTDKKLSIEHIRVLGKPSPKEELGTDVGGGPTQKKNKKKSGSDVLPKKFTISQQKVEERLNGSLTHRGLDIYFGHGKASVIHGFAIYAPPTKDPSTSPRLLRASVLHLVQKKKTKTLEPQGRIALGTYIVPVCVKEGATLVYNFDTPTHGNVLRLECIANYGSQDSTLLGKIIIF